MTIDTRKIFIMPEYREPRRRKYRAGVLAKDWLLAVTTLERELVRSKIRKADDFILSALVAAAIAQTDKDQAIWFADFLQLTK